MFWFPICSRLPGFSMIHGAWTFSPADRETFRPRRSWRRSRRARRDENQVLSQKNPRSGSSTAVKWMDSNGLSSILLII
jgi:hypothetical protein